MISCVHIGLTSGVRVSVFVFAGNFAAEKLTFFLRGHQNMYSLTSAQIGGIVAGVVVIVILVIVLPVVLTRPKPPKISIAPAPANVLKSYKQAHPQPVNLAGAGIQPVVIQGPLADSAGGQQQQQFQPTPPRQSVTPPPPRQRQLQPTPPRQSLTPPPPQRNPEPIVTSKQAQDLINSTRGNLLLVVFNPTCPPCKALKAALANIIQSGSLDATVVALLPAGALAAEAPSSALKSVLGSVGAVPYVALFTNGRKIKDRTGYMPEAQIAQFLSSD